MGHLHRPACRGGAGQRCPADVSGLLQETLRSLQVCPVSLAPLWRQLPGQQGSHPGVSSLPGERSKSQHELEKLESQLDKLKQQTMHTTANTFNFRRTESRFNRRSFVL